MQPLLEVRDLKVHFPIHTSLFSYNKEYVKAVDGVSFTVQQGETFGLVGESGCGKSTIGRTILRLLEPTSGTIQFAGKNIAELSPKQMRHKYRDLQMIFQDPFASLNPRKTVGALIEEPMQVHKQVDSKARKLRVAELLEMVGLDSFYANRYPHEFSGGQRQRINIARAISLNPKLIVADEAVSALDVSIQSQIINLLRKLQLEFGLAYVFISHNLSVVKHISDHIGVMYLGHLVETADKKSLFLEPLHPYTQALISAVPASKPGQKQEKFILEGNPPSPINPPGGCVFHPRCRFSKAVCTLKEPILKDMGNGHKVACHLYDEVTS